MRLTHGSVVRALPSAGGSRVASESPGALGTIVQGPVSHSGRWWEVDYDSGAQGWSRDGDLVLLACQGLVPATGCTPRSVPTAFRSMYAALSSALRAYAHTLGPSAGRGGVIYGAELLPANGNRGTSLLVPSTLESVRLVLDRMRELGIQGVTIAVSYPLLAPDFPNSQRYLAFFNSVATEVRDRRMTLDVEINPVFPPPYSELGVSYAGLTVTEYGMRVHTIAQTIIDQLKPNYLNLGAEPDTLAALTGIPAFRDPATFTAYVNTVLAGLDRGETKITAGAGTWLEGSDLVQRLASQTSLDGIAVHVYPIYDPIQLKRIAQYASVAKRYHKVVTLDEAWLNKQQAPLVSGLGGDTTVFARDNFGFWAPLDQVFLSLLAQEAKRDGIEYLSPFWISFFFSYLPYRPGDEQLSYSQLNALVGPQQTANIFADRFSSTGSFYKDLIAQRGAR